MKTNDLCKEELQKRIDAMLELLKAAQDCLDEKDYLQCAARLQLAAENGVFSEFQMSVFDSMSK